MAAILPEKGAFLNCRGLRTSPPLPGVLPLMDNQTIDALAAKVAERLASQAPGQNTSNDEWLTTQQAAKVTGIPKKTLESYRARGLGPSSCVTDGSFGTVEANC